jgi:hypothetical protein
LPVDDRDRELDHARIRESRGLRRSNGGTRGRQAGKKRSNDLNAGTTAPRLEIGLLNSRSILHAVDASIVSQALPPPLLFAGLQEPFPAATLAGFHA